MKGQLSIEYIVIIGLVLIILMPIVYLSWQYSQSTSQTTQVQSSLNTIIEASNLVYSQGPGARTRVLIYFPNNVNSTRIQGREVNIQLLVPGGTTDVFGLANGNLTGNISTRSGQHVLRIEMLANATVNISEGY
ncbi:class III signal peptide-containing protein [Candidatus Micrarchaeota archaeon]|nr:class III signal peptide-containing protein [Candidatus Micrarchaeota archaeon]